MGTSGVGHARAAVDHGDLDRAVASGHRGPHPTGAAPCDEGVLDEVGDDLLEAAGVGHAPRGRSGTSTTTARGVVDRGERGLDDLRRGRRPGG